MRSHSSDLRHRPSVGAVITGAASAARAAASTLATAVAAIRAAARAMTVSRCGSGAASTSMPARSSWDSVARTSPLYGTVNGARGPWMSPFRHVSACDVPSASSRFSK
eukprot:4806450-Prymnesium_polylepis.1